jgi:adenylate cyclase
VSTPDQAVANFSRYFAPSIAARIADGELAVPGGIRAPVVVLFSDVRGFTAIAESLPPVAMADQLNEYFAAMVECVFHHDGALDKFIGDALLAWWGVPDARADDGQRALAAAVEMMDAMAMLNARWAREGRPGWDIGIGIHGGEAFVGNIGSPQRLDFTIIGDTVNTANRVCRLAAEGEILITESIAARLGESGDAWPRRARPDLSLARRHGPPLTVWQVGRAA